MRICENGLSTGTARCVMSAPTPSSPAGRARARREMKVALTVLGDVGAPYLDAYQDHGIRMALTPGFVDVGSRPSALKRVPYEGGEIRLYPCDFEKWLGSADLRVLSIDICDAALTAACQAKRGEIELRRHADLADPR